MKKTCAIITTLLLYGLNAYSMNAWKATQVVPLASLTSEQKKTLATQYQRYRDRKFTQAKKEGEWWLNFCIAPLLLSTTSKGLIWYFSPTIRYVHRTHATVIIPFPFNLLSPCCNGYEPVSVSEIPCDYREQRETPHPYRHAEKIVFCSKLASGISTMLLLYTGYTFTHIVREHAKTKPAYIENLTDFNHALKKEMGYPKLITTEDQKTWDVIKKSGSKKSYDFTDASTIEKVFDNDLVCEKIYVPYQEDQKPTA